jgi:GT2 family glycosyltransferase
MGERLARERAAPIAIAVVSWNTRELLDRCLRSLRADADKGAAEVWVVDNASSDGSPDMVREQHPWVRLIASKENLGYGRAINLVAERTSTPWLGLGNADVALREGALEALLAAGERDPWAAIVAPRLLTPDGGTQHSVWAFPTVGASLVQNLGTTFVPGARAERLALRGAWNPETARRVPWAEGAFLLVRRVAWNQVGGFDSEQWMSAEDLDLGWRLHEAGWFSRYEPQALVEHEGSAAASQVWGGELPIHWQRCAYAWMVRRIGRPRTVMVGAINFAGSAARYLRAVLRGGAGARERRHVLARWTAVHIYAIAPRKTLDRYR